MISEAILLIDDILNDIRSYIANFDDCITLLGGDFNCDLDSSDHVSLLVNDFARDIGLVRCDQSVPGFTKTSTYVNVALNCSSCVDFLLVSDASKVIDFKVVDEGSNLSDHLPITAELQCNMSSFASGQQNKQTNAEHTFLRWDHADLIRYYQLTGQHMQVILNELKMVERSVHAGCVGKDDLCNFINDIYDNIVSVLNNSAQATVPSRTKQFYKFWWDQELDCLKEESVNTHKLWKAAGKPHLGPIFEKYHKSKLLYKKRIRECQQQETCSYTNELHEALINKQGGNFWKCWQSKFGNKNNSIVHVDGITDANDIVNKFQAYFAGNCSSLTRDGADRLKAEYENKRSDYCGLPFTEEFEFDVELVEKSTNSLNKGKAAGLDGLTSEHLQHCHPAVFSLLTRLFNLMVYGGTVPDAFGLSYTVPLPKSNYAAKSKSLTVEDFRGISISPVISKIFEKCILERYSKFLETSDNQFGFKKNSSCSHAVYSVKCVIDNFTKSGSTVNLCALDLRKAFDKMNRFALYLRLMERMLPNNLLCVLEYWFSICVTCVRFGNCVSSFVKLECGIRQGGILSPYLFAVFIDDIVSVIQRSNFGCSVDCSCICIFLYADDIILLAPSVTALQNMINLCEQHLAGIDMALNATKSVCMRIGPRFDCECSELTTNNGESLHWVDTCRYLGIYIVSARQFKCSFDNNKRAYYRSFNAILGKVGRCASEEVTLKLINVKCLPVLCYGVEACPLNVADKRSFDFVFVRSLMKLFKTASIDIIHECEQMFCLSKVTEILLSRKRSFLQRYSNCDNIVCQGFADIAIAELLSLR